MKHFLKILTVAALTTAAPFAAHGLDIQDGEKVAFITGQAFDMWNWAPSGYLRLLTDELATSGIKKEPWVVLENVKTEQMLQRVDEVVIAKAPRYAIIVPGSVDYNPWAVREVAESFVENLKGVVEKLQAANIKPILVTAYPVASNRALASNENVAAHNEAIRALAQEKDIPLIDFTQVVDDAEKMVPFDGNPVAKCLVNQLFAAEVLRVLGYDNNAVAACRAAWLDKPGTIELMPSVSVNTYEKLKAAAKTSGQSVDAQMAAVLGEGVK